MWCFEEAQITASFPSTMSPNLCVHLQTCLLSFSLQCMCISLSLSKTKPSMCTASHAFLPSLPKFSPLFLLHHLFFLLACSFPSAYERTDIFPVFKMRPSLDPITPLAIHSFFSSWEQNSLKELPPPVQLACFSFLLFQHSTESVSQHHQWFSYWHISSFSTLALLTPRPGNSLLWGGCLCIVGHLAASLASTYQMPVSFSHLW